MTSFLQCDIVVMKSKKLDFFLFLKSDGMRTSRSSDAFQNKERSLFFSVLKQRKFLHKASLKKLHTTDINLLSGGGVSTAMPMKIIATIGQAFRFFGSEAGE